MARSGLAVEMTREVFDRVHLPAKIFFYLLTAAATFAFARYAWKRVRKYRRGRTISRLLRARPLSSSLAAIASNRTIARRDRATGVAHFFVFWGFITLFVGTVILTIDEDILAPLTHALGDVPVHFFHGPFY